MRSQEDRRNSYRIVPIPHQFRGIDPTQFLIDVFDVSDGFMDSCFYEVIRPPYRPISGDSVVLLLDESTDFLWQGPYSEILREEPDHQEHQFVGFSLFFPLSRVARLTHLKGRLAVPKCIIGPNAKLVV